MQRALSVVSGPGGAFSLNSVLDGSYFIEGAVDGYVSSGRDIQLRGLTIEDVEIRLDDGIGITGRVTDSSGHPVEGANVHAVSYEPEGRSAIDQANSDKDGFFRLGKLIPGMVVLRAQDGAGAVATAGPETVSPGTQRRIDLQLRAGAIVSGRVRFQDGEPAPLVRVQLDPRGARPGAPLFSISDLEGRYKIFAVPPGKARVRVDEGRTPSVYSFPDRKVVDVIGSEQIPNIDLVLQRRQSVSGMVVDPDGKPAAGAIVSATKTRGMPWGPVDTSDGVTHPMAMDASASRAYLVARP